jgi:hypothetical protein
MTPHQSKEFVAAVGAWLRFERLCSPSVEWQWERVVHEPLRRYLTAKGYAYIGGEWTSEREESRRGKFRFDYRYGLGKNRPVGVIEVKTSTAQWGGIVGDLAKLRVLGDGHKHMLVVGPTEPDKKHLCVMLSFDTANPELHVSRSLENEVWDKYHSAWTAYRGKRKDRTEGKGHTPNLTTTLEGLASGESMPFVAMWSVTSSAGRRAAHSSDQQGLTTDCKNPMS